LISPTPPGGDDHPPNDLAWTALPARLARLSPDFARFWDSSDVAGAGRRLKRFRYFSAGPLTSTALPLLMADDPTIRIVILYPATASDAAKLERLAR
jgi:MmyB-like transcription regulator ligand binding domain